MKRFILAIVLTLTSLSGWAAEPAVEGLQLAEAPINRADVASIKRGATFFAANCLSCHTLKYLRYDKLSQEAGITYDKMPLNVKSWPNNITPPDLSLVTDVRGVNWIYTYLHSFYVDPTQPMGSNNLLVPNSAMTNILAAYQGTQKRVEHPTHDLLGHVEWYDVLELVKQGSMTPDQFDTTMADVTNYLAYAAQPFHADQVKLGKWVLAFLALMFVLMYMLKREYWKDIKHNDNDHKTK